MKLFDNEFVTISLDPAVPCLEWIGKKYMSGEAFRESEEQSLKFFIEHKKKHPKLEWFVDARNIGPISPTDTDWVAEQIMPKFAKAGLSKEGFVVPEQVLGQMAVKNFISASGEIILIKVFDTVEAAKSWLGE